MNILIAIGILTVMSLLYCCIRAGAVSDQRMEKYNKEILIKQPQKESQNERSKMQAGNTDTQKYAKDKPSNCAYCYFWIANKKCCGQKECYYLLHDDASNSNSETTDSQETDHFTPEEIGNCKTCVYGRHSPCIGYCIKKILLETNRMKQDGLEF